MTSRITYHVLRFTFYVSPWPLRLLAILILLAACNRQTPTPTPLAAPPPAEGATGALAPATDTPAPTATPGPNPTPTPDLSGRIVLWHSWAEADGDALAAILLGFQEAYPNLAVDTLFVAYNDLPQSYADAVIAGGGPDVVLAPSWWLGDMVAAGVVQSLDGLVPPAEQAAYWPAALDNLRHGGQLYGLPTHVELVSLFYNQALVSPDQLPAATGDLLALAQQNPAQGSGLYASLYHLAWGLPAYGAGLFDDSGRVTLDQNSGAANFLSWLQKMNETPGVFVSEDYGMLLDRFKKSEFAFFVDGPWAIDDLRTALGDNLRVTPLPAGPAGPAQPWLSADGVFLNPRAAPDQQQRALAFARFITNPASGETLARMARRLPANQAAGVNSDPLLQGFLAQTAAAQAMPTLPEMENVWGYAGDMLLKVLNGVSDPQTAVIETTTLINEANGR
jgi:arabinogalactan oligomer/maltooligosaccharide transport system substrate-binding protein